MANFKETWDRLISYKIFKLFLFFLAFIILVLLMDNLVMPWYTHHGQKKEMPDVIEKNINEAIRILENQKFNVIIADSVYDEHFQVGSVVEQMPLPYSTVKMGRNVYLKVSIGEKPIIMPNLFSLSPRDAELKLKSYGLELETIMYAYNDLYPEGAVIAQSYPQGQRIKKGSSVRITVSLGEMPSQKTIPQLVGRSLSAARRQLELLGVSEISVQYEENENILPLTVMDQSLEAGHPIEEDTKIELTVSELTESKEEE